jgi:hypothetical protein
MMARYFHVPGSDKGYKRSQINDGYNVPDWFPNMHSNPVPDSVPHGKPGLYQGCGLCHLPTGFERPENISINGLPVGYIMEQIEDFKNDRRHSSMPNMGLIPMIPVAKNIAEGEAKEAAEYFSKMKPTKYIRVVETDTVPKTRPNARMLVLDEDGGTEPIGNRVIEVPENVELVEMRDSAPREFPTSTHCNCCSSAASTAASASTPTMCGRMSWTTDLTPPASPPAVSDRREYDGW